MSSLRRLILLVCPTALMAQTVSFASLAADATGNVYLTSPLILRTAQPANAGNVFRYVPASGWSWFAPDWGPAVGMVDVSSAGDVMAATAVRNTLQCVLSACKLVTTVTAKLAAPGYRLDNFGGYIQVSGNGRFALLSSGTSQTVVDLRTGASQRYTGIVTASKQAITDNGCALLFGSGATGLLLRCPDADRHFAMAARFGNAKINAAGTAIVYSYLTGSQPEGRLLVRAIDVSTEKDVVVAQELPPLAPVAVEVWGSSTQIWISHDGNRIVYLAATSRDPYAAQVFSVSSDGSGRRQLTGSTAYPEGFVEAMISPDGSLAYAISQSNRVLRIGIGGGQTNEIVPRTPVVTGYGYGYNGMAPGSISLLRGNALSDGAASAGGVLPLTLAGAGVKVAGRYAPILSTQPYAIRYQIPFETTPGLVAIEVLSDSPFQQNPAGSIPGYPIVAWDLSFLELSPDPAISTGFYAIHQDFGSFVTLDHPAQPDEIVHFYVVGLGQVSPAVQTGQPAPFDPPAQAVYPPQCHLGDGGTVPVRFAGLAPGLTGIYQLSLQLPHDLPLKSGEKGHVDVSCESLRGDFVSQVTILVIGAN